MTSAFEAVSSDWLTEQVRAMKPWHHDIELTDDVSTGRVFSPTGRLVRADNDGVVLISPRQWFNARILALYPDGLGGKRFLDCGCNAGAYCFLAREFDATACVGFDIRDHWIRQAEFVKQHRTVAPTDRVEFHLMDIYELPERSFEPFDVTYFSGLLYHLPDPIGGLKIAADLTRDVIVLNTSLPKKPPKRLGLTLLRKGLEARRHPMHGVHEIVWAPNNPETVVHILLWLGFVDMKLTVDSTSPTGRRRIEIIAARDTGRLDALEGEPLSVQTDA